jgi:hypothetical protein
MMNLPFANRFGHTICQHCKKTYVKGEYYPCCCWECHHLEHEENGSNGKLIRNICQRCGREFKNFNKKTFCSEMCKGTSVLKRQSDEEKAKTDNALWLENKHSAARLRKSNKNRLSYDTLNRIAERKRVMDESGWDHFNRGRKWNRI